MVDTDEVGVGPRYDEVADWYAAWVAAVPAPIFSETDLVPARLDGARWLDIGCGTGRASRELAQRGAAVVGVELSKSLLKRALDADPRHQHQIRYIAADVTKPTGWWDGAPFEGAVCETALMDIDDLDGAAVAIANVLYEGAPFLASIVHPCFPGNESGLSSWPPGGDYFSEGWWTSADHNPNGVRIRVGSNHRTLSTYVNALTAAGLQIEKLIEPPARLPTLLVIACRRR